MVFGTLLSDARAHLTPSGGLIKRGAGVDADELSILVGAAGAFSRVSVAGGDSVAGARTCGSATVCRSNARRAITAAKITPATNAWTTIERPRCGFERAIAAGGEG